MATEHTSPIQVIRDPKGPLEYRKLLGIVYLIIVLGAFSWGKEFLLPIILAILISFLLAPVVSRLERWKFRPVLAVLTVVGVAFAIIGLVSMTISVETLNLVNSLPKYRDNINAKWDSIQHAPSGPLNLAVKNIGELVADFSKVKGAQNGVKSPEPTKVEIVSGADSVLALVKGSMAPIMGPIAEFAVVVVLVVFMLLERKQLRIRLLRLIGHSRLGTTTLAVDEAGWRLSQFLLTQLVVNGCFALAVGVGLSLIGIPNAILWATLTLVLRFVPYVGLWISAFCPLILSIAISTTWTAPLLTLLLYGILEIFTNNVIEPIVLGGSTGMSPLAIIVSALFWTWLWGPIGLLLATPITACLVALGRYFPAFQPYCVLLASEPPTSAETRLIRLLTEGRLPEAKAMLHELSGLQLSLQTAEELIVPTVRVIENELFPGSTISAAKSQIYGQMRELIDELVVEPEINVINVKALTGNDEDISPHLVIVPYAVEGDEIVGKVLQRLLEGHGIRSEVLPWRMLRSQKAERLKELSARLIVFSAIESRHADSMGKMARATKVLLPEAMVLIGMWSLPPEGAARLIRKIKESGIIGIHTSLQETVRSLTSLVTSSEMEKRVDPSEILEAISEPKT